MYIRMLVGAKIHQILDVEPEAARALIASGRGENPHAFVPVPELTVLERAAAAKKLKVKKTGTELDHGTLT